MATVQSFNPDKAAQRHHYFDVLYKFIENKDSGISHKFE